MQVSLGWSEADTTLLHSRRGWAYSSVAGERNLRWADFQALDQEHELKTKMKSLAMCSLTRIQVSPGYPSPFFHSQTGRSFGAFHKSRETGGFPILARVSNYFKTMPDKMALHCERHGEWQRVKTPGDSCVTRDGFCKRTLQNNTGN